MSRLVWVFAPLLLFQWLSVALHLPKGSELGDGLVWIGGYNHEAAFSVALLTGFTVACLAYRLHPLVRLFLLFATIFGVFLADYRTAILAMLPLAFATFWIGISQYMKSDQRRPVSAVVLMLCLVGAAVVAIAYQDRFADLATFLSDPGSLIKSPRSFTQMDRQIMSGRALIWSEYLTAYANGTSLNHLFGFGPESWTKAFDVYPQGDTSFTLYEDDGVTRQYQQGASAEQKVMLADAFVSLPPAPHAAPAGLPPRGRRQRRPSARQPN